MTTLTVRGVPDDSEDFGSKHSHRWWATAGRYVITFAGVGGAQDRGSLARADTANIGVYRGQHRPEVSDDGVGAPGRFQQEPLLALIHKTLWRAGTTLHHAPARRCGAGSHAGWCTTE